MGLVYREVLGEVGVGWGWVFGGVSVWAGVG